MSRLYIRPRYAEHGRHVPLKHSQLAIYPRLQLAVSGVIHPWSCLRISGRLELNRSHAGQSLNSRSCVPLPPSNNQEYGRDDQKQYAKEAHPRLEMIFEQVSSPVPVDPSRESDSESHDLRGELSQDEEQYRQ